MSLEPINFEHPIPLFPLPNCVLFPGVVQPLHIFEPRYQQMMAYALNNQSAIAIALLKPGWEKNYHGCPPVHEILCVGRIVSHEKLHGGADEGKYNLLLHGVTRARILSEEKQGDPTHGLFRIANLEPLPDSAVMSTSTASALCLQRKVLRELFERTSLKDLTIAHSIQALFDSSVPAPRLVDVLSFTLVQDIPTKQRLLEEIDPARRGELLLNQLVALAHQLDSKNSPLRQSPAHSTWPPPLSAN